MEIIGAAAVIAVAVVLAAVIYGRTHRGAGGGSRGGPEPSEHERELSERGADLAKREENLVRREAALERERQQLADTRQELGRALEQVSGLSAAKAKQLLLAQVEDQARHDAARKIRQIEQETGRPISRDDPELDVYERYRT